MAEIPRSSSASNEIAEYTARKKAEDKQKLLEAIFDDSVVGNREQDQARVQEGTQYYQHLEQLAQRPDNHDPYEASLMESAHSEALVDNAEFDRRIQEGIQAEKDKIAAIENALATDPRVRRLLAMGIDIADRLEHAVTPQDDEPALQRVLADKEAKFQELFDQYEANGAGHDVLEYILEKTYAVTPEAPAAAPVASAPDVAPDITPIIRPTADPSAVVVDNDPAARDGDVKVEADSAVSPDDIAAHEGESQDEYEARHGVTPEVESDAAALPDWETNKTVEYKGEKFLVTDTVRDPASGEPTAYILMDADGNRQEVPVAEALRGDSPDVTADTPDQAVVDSETTLDADENASEKVTTKEKLKAWWGSRKSMRQLFDPSYWSGRWTTDPLVNKNVADTMTDEQKQAERQKARRRTFLGRGAAVVALAAVAGGLFLGLKGDSGPERAPANVEVAADDAAAEQTPDEQPASEQAPAPEADPAFTVPAGGGGEALFRGLGLEPSAWYNNEQTLLEQFPDDFYQMNDGHVGIARPGQLPPRVQDFINTLRG